MIDTDTTTAEHVGHVTQTLFGHAVERREDPGLLRGESRFVGDLPAEGALHAVFVRSQVAHGILRSVTTTGALGLPGVVAVLTASDLGLPRVPEWPPPPGGAVPELERPCLAEGKVRFVGEPVAVVVAETLPQAVDAAEQVIVDIEELPAVVDPLRAIEPGAPLLFEGLGTNVVLDARSEDPGDVLEGAAVVVRARFKNQRVAAAPLETNAVLARPAPGGRLECFVSSQTPFRVRTLLARALGRDEGSIRVATAAVGGGFGAKGGVYPEQVVVAALAQRLGRPVRFAETRSENLVSMTQGRGQVQDVELGARADGTIVGLRARTITEIGAYVFRGRIPFMTSRTMATGPYRIPRLDLTSLGVVTNTTPIGPYRGAGRPEATAMLERSMDLLAAALGLDPAEVRRRNLLRADELPYLTPTGASYDSGDYERALETVLELAGYEELRAEQALRRARGDTRQLGIGLSTFVEISGTGSEYGAVSVETDGTILVATGSSPHGQGHETTLAQVVAELLGVPFDDVRVVHSDTDLVARGTGTFGSRSGQLGGSAAFQAGEVVLERARQLAARLFEASAEDLVRNGDGSFSVAGVPSRRITWADLAAAAPSGAAAQSAVDSDGALAAEADFAQALGTFPFGAHLALVEVDVETGQVELLRLVAVDDCGRVLNPLIVTGQVHGGLAQGIAQALYEQVRYDDDGNPLTTTFADYLVPSAADLPSFEVAHTVTPSPRNPLGMKGIGESGTVGSTPAVQNAVIDALAPLGVTHLDMPLDPERVWRGIRAAASGADRPAPFAKGGGSTS